MNANLYSALESGFPNVRSQPCIEVPDGRTYTWSELEAGTARIANLLASLQLASEARVVAYVEKSPEALMLYLATVRAGHVFIPLNSAYRENELRHLLGDAEPSVVVCAPKSLETAGTIAREGGVPHVYTLDDNHSGSLLDAAAGLSPAFNTSVRKDDDPAAILYTSGTTGKSKGAILSHRNLSANARLLHEAWGWRQDDVLLHILPIFHAHGLFMAANGALLAGARMIWLAKFDAKRVIELLPRSTMMMGVPTHYARLLTETGLNRDSCGSIRVFISGSAPLSAAAFRAFQERTGHAIVERYGLTETLILVSTPYDTTHNPRLPGAVGMPLPGVRLRIVDDTGQSCPPGGVGHIQVQAPGVFKGYWRLPERARDDFTPDGWFRTGDLGRWGNPPGESGIPDHYLSIVGRDKDLIISGGFNVYAKEIEDVIDGVPGVAETAVIGAAHPDFGEAVVAVVVPRASAALKPAQLIAELKTRMANFKVPKRIHFVPELPRNAMGKVRKNVLRQSFGFPVEVEPRAAEPARVSGQL